MQDLQDLQDPLARDLMLRLEHLDFEQLADKRIDGRARELDGGVEQVELEEWVAVDLHDPRDPRDPQDRSRRT